MRLPLSRLAQSDLEDIAISVSADRPRAAQRLLRRILEKCRLACENPLGYQACEQLRPGLRRAVCRPYIIFLVVNQNGVRIERTVHGARDLPSLFPPED